jgi:hypothetical protein
MDQLTSRLAPGAADSPYRQAEDPKAIRFAVTELATSDLAREAACWASARRRAGRVRVRDTEDAIVPA